MRESAYPVGTGPKTRNPHDRDVARVFARDHFTCVYCGRRTVVLQVMQMVSNRFRSSSRSMTTGRERSPSACTGTSPPALSTSAGVARRKLGRP